MGTSLLMRLYVGSSPISGAIKMKKQVKKTSSKSSLKNFSVKKVSSKRTSLNKIEIVSVSNFKLYIYLPKSYYKSRFNKDTSILEVEDSNIDYKGRGVFKTLNDAIKSLAKNRFYANALDELILLEVEPTVDSICDQFIHWLGGPDNIRKTYGYHFKVNKEIDFKKLLSVV